MQYIRSRQFGCFKQHGNIWKWFEEIQVLYWIRTAINGVQYAYDLDLLIYTKNVDGTIIHSDTEELMQEMVLEHMGIDMQAMTNASNSMFGEQATAMMGMGGSSMNLWQELLPGENGNPVNDLLKKQYDVVYGSWPNS